MCAVGFTQALAMPHASGFFLCHGITILADGWVVFTGHLTRALLLGISFVIVGSVFAGSNLAPVKYIYEDGVWFKRTMIISCESAWSDSKC